MVHPAVGLARYYSALSSWFFMFCFRETKKRLTFFPFDPLHSMRIVLVVRAVHDVPRGWSRDAGLIVQDGIPDPD